MTKLDNAPEVISLAAALNLDPRTGAVRQIIEHCRKRIDGWVSDNGGVNSLAELERVVCKKLNLVFEEIRSDSELVEVSQKYIAMGEGAFASLAFQLDAGTFATLMERHNVKAGSVDRYVAVIDCRGQKAARRFFTRWHEISHLLTLVRQLELPFHRSTKDQNPVERLMDVIAGEVAFYEPLFMPVLNDQLGKEKRLTFLGVDRLRDAICPEASFQATLIAAVKRTPLPVIQLEAQLAYKKAETSALRSGQMSMFPGSTPAAKLRAVRAVSNEAATQVGFRIHPNMQIPSGSIIAKHYEETDALATLADASGTEDFAMWRPSDGKPLGFGQIDVQARHHLGTMFALIQRA